MTISIFAFGYVLLSLFAGLVFYCACVVGSWADDTDPEETVLEYPPTSYRVDFRDLAEEPKR
jgi:hypothetical protein